MLSRPRWRATLAAIVLLGAPAVAQVTAGNGTPYERLDDSRLAERLTAMHMTELLEALLDRSATLTELQRKHLRAQAKISAAARTQEETKRNKILDEAIALQDEVIALTKNAETGEELLGHFRYRINRVVTEGRTKTHAYVERLQYFLERPGDAQAVATLTESALGLLGRLTTQMETTRDNWSQDDDRFITGEYDKLEVLLKEARYHGAWIRFYRGIVLPKPAASDDTAERTTLLRQAIEDVAEWANEEDNASGVEFDSLLLSGMAARELGEWRNALSFLKRAGHKDAGALRLKAAFETARCFVDQGKFAEAEKFIRTDFATVGREVIGQVAVDMQSSLLNSHVFELRAASVTQSNPSLAESFKRQSVEVLLDFIEKYPQYREAFMEIIGPKFEGGQTKDLSPGIQAALGIWRYNKNTLASRAKAAELFETVRQNKAAAEGIHAMALWYLGMIKNAELHNREAAKYFQELAELHPADERAKNAALNAVKSLEGILKEKHKQPHEMDRDFLQQYAGALKVLADGWGRSDPKIGLYYYDLGLQYEALGRTADAVAAYSKVPAQAEVYMHSWYRVLDLRVQELLDKPAAEHLRRQGASNLIEDLRGYGARARQYVASAKPERAEQVRGWAARCQMLEAQLHKDVLKEPAKAVEAARQAAAKWPEVPDIKTISQEFVVRVLVETGQTKKATELLHGLGGAEDLVADLVNQLQVRIDRLEIQTDAGSRKELADLRKEYRVFADRLFQSAKDRKLPEEQMYPFYQALAGAYAFGSEQEATQALEIYEKLNKAKPNQAVNIRGLARANRRLGNNPAAMEQYDKLIDGLPEDTAAWWRAQLERLQFFLEIRSTSASSLRGVLVHIRQLRRFKGGRLGGFYRQFAAIEGRTKELLDSASQPAGQQ